MIDDAGVINSTPPFTTAPPDASGGRGSFLEGLLDTLTSGVNAFAQAKISETIGKNLQSGLLSVDDQGHIVYKAAPSVTAADAAKDTTQAPVSFFKTTPGIVTLIVAGLAGVAVLVAVARR